MPGLKQRSGKTEGTFGLTTRQRQMLDFIVTFQAREQGRSPTFDQLAASAGLSSRGQIHRFLECLEERGHICRTRNLGKSSKITVLTRVSVSTAPDGAPLFFVPVTHREGVPCQ